MIGFRPPMGYPCAMADDQRLANPNAATSTGSAPARFSAEEFEDFLETAAAARIGRFELRGGELYRRKANSFLPARFTADEFEEFLRTAAAAKIGRFELRRGEIYRMNPTFTAHARMRFRLARLLEDTAAVVDPNLAVIDEVTVRFGEFVPLPDIVMFQGPVKAGAVPGSSVRLIIEVADTTLADDLGPKRDLYAAAGLVEHWVVDLVGKTILQHAQPVEGAFTRTHTVRRGEMAEALTLPGLHIDTAALPWD